MKRKNTKINSSLKSQITKTLANIVAELTSTTQVNKFFGDFLTDTEYETLAKRFAIAYWLKKGRSYANIKNNLKVSSATIATVQSLMEKPGFKLALKKLEAEEWANLWAKKIKSFVGR